MHTGMYLHPNVICIVNIMLPCTILDLIYNFQFFILTEKSGKKVELKLKKKN